MKILSMKELNDLKVNARKLGNCSGSYVYDLHLFWIKNNLPDIREYGKLWEIAAFFVLGVLQSSMVARGIYFFVYTNTELDGIKIDLCINGRPLQLKYDWSEVSLEDTRRKLENRGIAVVNAQRGESGIDIFRRILSAAGFSDAAVEKEVFENPGFDAAEEVFQWFVTAMQQTF